MRNDSPIAEAESNWLKVFHSLNEAQRRWYAAEKAISLGRGGILRVHQVTGLSRTTIIKAMGELQQKDQLDTSERIREPGGGRKKITEADRSLERDLEKVLGESTSGDPMSVLKWTTKSTRNLAEEMTRRGHRISAMSVCHLLHELDYSLQANRKTNEGESAPGRDEQFRRINETARAFLRRGEPVISVDTKKKERVGEFKSPGKTWRKQGEPREVNVYDYPHLGVGTAVPYGVYDIQRNQGMVNVGMSHDTAEFAVASIRQWWRRFGQRQYPQARRLLICADGGGSNGSRCRAWKYHVQRFADEAGLSISVCHYPPGASKWNKVEHRMFSFISLNWKGEPLVSFETVVKLIGDTKTKTGLRVKARLDKKSYDTGVHIGEEDMRQLQITYDDAFPQWNYTIISRRVLKKKHA